MAHPSSGIISAKIKSVLIKRHGKIFFSKHCHYIKTHRCRFTISKAMQIIECHAGYHPLLSHIHRLLRQSACVTASIFDLDKREISAFPRHNVYLTAAAAEIAFQYHITVLFQPFTDEGFFIRTDLSFVYFLQTYLLILSAKLRPYLVHIIDKDENLRYHLVELRRNHIADLQT